VAPYPQQVALTATDFEFRPPWRVEQRNVPADDATRASLIEELTSRHHLPSPDPNGSLVVRLEIRAGSVEPGEALDRNRDALAAQAYRLELRPKLISITANAPAGLFYGVETLAQLLKSSAGGLWLPGGVITDWPDLEQRNIYWDDAHHLDRPEALKHAIREAAFFKINGFVIKLEGHFEFRHAPAVVEPYALSPAELQDLTNYALRYHVQLIPYLDSPGHIAFILKHPEYAGLRAFPDSNYELCAVNPDSYKLIEGMFQDLLDANKGVRLVYLSTDEPYYVGWADNSQCNEKSVADGYGSRGKLLAEFTSKVAGYLHDRGRDVVFWGEYPLKVQDIDTLAPFLINGEVYGPEFDAAFRRRGIRQMIYTSTQGEERIFPQYFAAPASQRLRPSRNSVARIGEVFDQVSSHASRRIADVMGMNVAGWADAGQHPENFWLGYVIATAAGWRPSTPDAREITAAFFPQFYGPGVIGMDRAWQLLSLQGQFWADSWDAVESKSRKPIWGNSDRIFTPPHPRHDQSISLPPVPADDLTRESNWGAANAKRLELASQLLTENDELLGILNMNMLRAEQNRYNIEVLISDALLCRQNLEFLLDLGRVDGLLSSAATQAREGRAKQAAAALDRALDTMRSIRDRRNATLAGVTETWYKTWFPRVAEANGRRFVHELDDVKDHVPDRTVDMTYLILRELQLPADQWADQVQTVRNRYVAAQGLPSREGSLEWSDTSSKGSRPARR
jgi:hypothetical protein